MDQPTVRTAQTNIMQITLKGQPKSTQHCYRFTSGGGYMTNACTHIKFDYIHQAKQQWRQLILEDELVVVVTLYFGDKRKRDIDNFNKLWMDALEGVVYVNDSQIRQLTLIKDYDKENPRIEINII